MASGEDLSGFSMFELFREEVETQAAVLSAGLLTLEQDPGSSEELERLMRAAHSLKGAARIVGLDPVVEVAHAMEDDFVAAQQGRIGLGPEHVDVLLRGLDAITGIALLQEAETPSWLAEHGPEIARLVTELHAVLVPSTAPPPAVEPPPAPAPANAPPAVPAQAPAPTAAGHTATELRDLRISAESLTRLMGLAGEAVVAAKWLEPFSLSLRELKKAQLELGDHLETLRRSLAMGPDGPPAGHALTAQAIDLVATCRRVLAHRMGELDTFALRTTNLASRLYRHVLSSRMRPFGDGCRGFPRMVRDLAREVGKQVRLEILGNETGVDRDILEKLEAPLNHILRNSVDHGIEAPAERTAAGKNPTGVISLEARHQAGMLLVTVRDDGRGIDLDRLQAKIVEKGLSQPEVVARMTKAELLEFVFLPGFSTAATVTQISGRGVGLDVVQRMVQEVGGALRVESEPGLGVTFSLELPVTRSVLRTLLVEVSGEPLAFPLEGIDHTLLVARDDIQVLEDKQYFMFDGNPVGVVGAHQVLDLPAPESNGDELSVVVVSDQHNRYGVVVDRFVGEREVVVHSLDERLGKIADISAAALMEDGSPVLIVDAADMVRSVHNLLSGGRLRRVATGAEAAAAAQRKRLLVVDDSLTVREVLRQRFENAGYAVDTSIDGMDGWNAARSAEYDLIITDIDMPRMTGIELVTLIKADPRLAAIPVIIVSYKDREEDRLKGLEAGASYYVTKSDLHDQTILEAVVDLVGRADE